MNLVLQLLLNLINNDVNTSTNYYIAKTLLENSELIKNLSIVELAKLCSVSNAKISRFCRELGFSDFSEFKEMLSYAGSIDRKTSVFDSNNFRFSEDKMCAILLESVNKELDLFSKTIDLDKITSLVKNIYHYKNVAIFGILNSATSAADLQINLINFNKFTVSFPDMSKQMEYIKNANKDTLIIILSISGQYLFDNKYSGYYHSLQYMTESKAKFVLVTKGQRTTNISNISEIIQIGDLNYHDNFYKYSLQFFVDLVTIQYKNYIDSMHISGLNQTHK